MTFDSISVFPSDRVFAALIHAEEEGARVARRTIRGWEFPLDCCESAKDEILGCLNDGQRPSLEIATSMEIL